MNYWRVIGSACAACALGCGESRPGASPDVPEWQLDSLITIGAPGDSVEIQRVRSVLLGPAGTVFVADVGARRVREFALSGRLLREIGRDGSGPGEYASPSSLAFFGDTLAVLDIGNARIGMFTTSGAWAGSAAAPRISGPEIRLLRASEATVYGYGLHSVAGGRARLAYVRYTSKGPQDTVARDTTQVRDAGTVTCEGSDKGLRFFSTPWTPRRLDAPGPRATLLTAMNDQYAILQLGPRGDTLRTFRGPSGATPIPDAEWVEAGAELRQYLTADPAAKCDRTTLARPASKPSLRAFFWGADGTLWVERFADRGFRFDVFDTTGVRIGTMTAPERVAGIEPHIRGERLVLVAETAEGAHVVRVFSVRRARGNG